MKVLKIAGKGFLFVLLITILYLGVFNKNLRKRKNYNVPYFFNYPGNG